MNEHDKYVLSLLENRKKILQKEVKRFTKTRYSVLDNHPHIRQSTLSANKQKLYKANKELETNNEAIRRIKQGRL